MSATGDLELVNIDAPDAAEPGDDIIVQRTYEIIGQDVSSDFTIGYYLSSDDVFDAGDYLLGTESIKWNFTKFVVDRSGSVVARHAPSTAPERLEGQLQDLLR